MRRGLSLSLASGRGISAGRLTAHHSLLSTQGRGVFSPASSRSVSFFKQDAKSVEAKVGLYDHDELPYFAPKSMPAESPASAEQVLAREVERSLPAKQFKTPEQVEQLLDELDQKEEEMDDDESYELQEFACNYEEPVTADPMKVLFTKEYWEDPENWDPHDYMWAVKVWQLENSLGLKTPEERLAWRQSVDISSGYMTLEWVLPSPPPEHTFDEYPIIKDNPDDPGV